MSQDNIKPGENNASEKDRDYYLDTETGLLVFTAAYHLKRGYCCGSGCRHCPYPKKSTSEPGDTT